MPVNNLAVGTAVLLNSLHIGHENVTSCSVSIVAKLHSMETYVLYLSHLRSPTSLNHSACGRER